MVKHIMYGWCGRGIKENEYIWIGGVRMVMKLENCCKNVMKKIDGKYSRFLFLILLIYFLCNYAQGLIVGGRWDLYQAVATADRFLNGQGFYYSAAEASSPYFPGVSFLAVLVGKLFYSWRDYILLSIASSVGTFFAYKLICIGGQ